ncbi:MAG: hypothetical protein ISP86_04425, partial [Shewanellaceae bacterium]|nr:hypothetical protein [Shewanellaceae bacterium]
DEWLSSCFLIEFYDKYGFEFYKKFYKIVDDKTIGPGSYKLNQLREDFVTAGDEDVNTIFEEWKLPVESKAASSTPNP